MCVRQVSESVSPPTCIPEHINEITVCVDRYSITKASDTPSFLLNLHLLLLLLLYPTCDTEENKRKKKKNEKRERKERKNVKSAKF